MTGAKPPHTHNKNPKKTVGSYLKTQLKNLQNNNPDLVLDVRGKGLIVGMEFTVKPEQKETFTEAALRRKGEIANLLKQMKNNGVLLGQGGPKGTCIRIKPPMCWTMEVSAFLCGRN